MSKKILPLKERAKAPGKLIDGWKAPPFQLLWLVPDPILPKESGWFPTEFNAAFLENGLLGIAPSQESGLSIIKTSGIFPRHRSLIELSHRIFQKTWKIGSIFKNRLRSLENRVMFFHMNCTLCLTASAVFKAPGKVATMACGDRRIGAGQIDAPSQQCLVSAI